MYLFPRFAVTTINLPDAVTKDKYFCMEQNVGQLERRRNRFSRKQR